MHAIEKGLAAVIDCAGARSIRPGVRIDIEHRLAVLIEMAVALIAYLVIDDGKLTEIAAVRVPNYGGPTTEQVLAREGVEIFRPPRLDYDRAKESVAGLKAVHAVTVEVVRPLRLVAGYHPFIGHAGIGRRVGVGVRGCGRLPCCRDVQAGAVNVDTCGLLRVDGVSQSDPKAIALIRPYYQRLNGIALQANRDRGVGAASSRQAVLCLFFSGPIEVLLQHEHAAVRVEVQEAIERNLYVDGRDAVFSGRRSGIAEHA